MRARGLRPSLASLIVWLLLGGCRRFYDPPAPILTLVPTGMLATGPSAKADEQMMCLIAGASLQATVYVHEPTVTIIVIAFTPTPPTPPGMMVYVDSNLIATDTMRALQLEASVYRVAAERGERVLRVMVPPLSPGVLCVRQVVVTQP